MSKDDLIEKIAVLHNGGSWPEHYKEQHRELWTKKAEQILELVEEYNSRAQ